MYNSNEVPLEKLATASIPKLLLHYSLPAMLGLISVALYEIIDRIFVGQFVGNTGLAIMAVGMPFVIFIGSCCLMLRIGGSSILARSLGKGDIAFSEQILANTFFMLLGGGLLLTLLGLTSSHLIVRLSGVNEALFQQTVTYVQIIALGAPFLFLGNGANAIMRATGAPRKGLLLVAGSCSANVVLDALLVGYFDFGVPGAAWATVISQGLGAAYGLSYFLSKERTIRLSFRKLLPNRPLFYEIISIGFAYALFEINFMVVVAITNTMLEAYGDIQSLAAIAVVSSCVTFLYMPATGLDEGMQPVIGYNFGAGAAQRVRRIILWALGAGLSFFIVSFLIIQLGAEAVVSLFVDDNPLFQETAAHALRITFAVAPFMAFMIVIPGILSALGEARYNFFLSIGIQLGVQIPALFILPHFLGTDGIWFTFPLVDIASSVLGIILLLKSLKRHGLLPQASTQDKI